ncbi:rho guanine nucleotide exchange factor 5-like, partial [Hypanus sabinus]|uniref:rho guanine nucleotide exchange factor 5-like n=1 Tax=Hypanus sabinus TaxID=79690 RepID=UPI0028C3FFAE
SLSPPLALRLRRPLPQPESPSPPPSACVSSRPLTLSLRHPLPQPASPSPPPSACVSSRPSFLADLEENFEENILCFDVCGTLLSHLPDFRLVYIPYLTNQSYQDKTFKNLIKKNPQFLRVVESLEAHPVCQRLTLKSFLILPFQRIARLRLLVQNILQRSVRGSEDEEKALRAAEGLGEVRPASPRM